MRNDKQESGLPGVPQAPSSTDSQADTAAVPSITLRAANHLHFRLLVHGLDELRKAQGGQSPAVLELEATLRNWELFSRERGGFSFATAFSTDAHFE